MKQELKKGDRVLVRNNDLAEWKVGIFIQQRNHSSLPFWVNLEKDSRTYGWTQCRHIDDFRAGDKVQVKNIHTEKWEEAVYACYVPHDLYEHRCFSEDKDGLISYEICRWHPSMPWANWAEKKEHLNVLNGKLAEASADMYDMLKQLIPRFARMNDDDQRLYLEAKRLIKKIES